MPPDEPERTRSRAGLAELVVVWTLTGTLVLLFARVTAIGPVVLTLRGSHGVHLGDLVMLLFGVAVAGGVTLRLFRRQ